MKYRHTLLILLPLFFGCSQNRASAPLIVAFEYAVEFHTMGPTEAWIPIPRSDPFQTITDLHIETDLTYQLVTDTLYGNRMVYINTYLDQPGARLTISFTVTRVEASSVRAQLSARERELYMSSYERVPLDDRFHAIADSINANGTDFGRGVYNYILEHMTYDKSGEGWGQGDANYACDVGKGNCTDYHSLFNVVVRSQGLPARFHIGFPIPAGKGGVIAGYHCWTEFYINEQWVPVDISEADQIPRREAYYYGHLDERRVDFTVGRDIPLPNGGLGEVVNYFIYPYVKSDQQVTTDYTTRFTFKELS